MIESIRLSVFPIRIISVSKNVFLCYFVLLVSSGLGIRMDSTYLNKSLDNINENNKITEHFESLQEALESLKLIQDSPGLNFSIVLENNIEHILDRSWFFPISLNVSIKSEDLKGAVIFFSTKGACLSFYGNWEFHQVSFKLGNLAYEAFLIRVMNNSSSIWRVNNLKFLV
jgi:hypothetical protein